VSTHDYPNLENVMTQKLTRLGARNVTSALDRIATLIQENAAVLGIDPKIALDFAGRTDLISDAVEATASINYPITATDFDAEEIAEKSSGPEEGDPDDAYMKSFTQTEHSELSGKVAALIRRELRKGYIKKKGSVGRKDFDAEEIAEKSSGPEEGDPDETYMATFDQSENSDMADKFAGFNLFAGAQEESLRSKLAGSQTIELDTPPERMGSRPALIRAVLKGTGLPGDGDDKEAARRSMGAMFGEETWNFSDVPSDVWRKAVPTLKKRISDMYRRGQIRYGSW
jgi:hypothetical protein